MYLANVKKKKNILAQRRRTLKTEAGRLIFFLVVCLLKEQECTGF